MSHAPSCDVGTDYLKQSASVAVFSESMQELCHKFAMSFNRASLSVGASTLQPNDAIVAQERSTKLVTRIPKAPLYTLLLANMLFVALGIALAVSAIARGGGEVREIQARLSIEGLAPPEITGQDLRVAVGRTLGWQQIKSTAFEITRVRDGYRIDGHGSRG